ncbi:MAG: hypothetical protein B6242_09995 [Anaerolineaceae bacterium 4572_78]|nr:MAG: hypothetical protein B6242_09995 [Anaerolineaceae bacterium 4572_78]
MLQFAGKHPLVQTQRILVIDDDVTILHLVRDKLDKAGFEVLTARSGDEAMAIISNKGLPHLAIVDIKMPGMDGLGFCKTVQQFSDLPVVMLTSVDEENTVIEVIESFAEDYITKPFSPRELVARVRRVLRRIGDFGYALEANTKIDDRFAVNFGQQEVILSNKVVSLTPTETKILYILMRNAGRIVTTNFLLSRTWPLDEIGEDVLRVHVYRIRRKIEVNPSKPRYIVTERGVGYSFTKKHKQ